MTDRETVDRLLGHASAERLRSQLEFVLEIDRLKGVLRRTLLNDGSRLENSAEHSWHLALMALVLCEWADEEIDVVRTVEMVLLHDIVEIDAGDTFCYDEEAHRDKEERERRAAERIFGLLPAEQERRFHELWREFEERSSPESRFANAVDRLQPMMHNYLTEGHSWQEHGVVREQVEQRNRPIDDGAPELWAFARRFLEDAVAQGWLRSEREGKKGAGNGS